MNICKITKFLFSQNTEIFWTDYYVKRKKYTLKKLALEN